MTDVFYCGIIDGNMSVGGNNKVVFQKNPDLQTVGKSGMI